MPARLRVGVDERDKDDARSIWRKRSLARVCPRGDPLKSVELYDTRRKKSKIKKKWLDGPQFPLY